MKRLILLVVLWSTFAGYASVEEAPPQLRLEVPEYPPFTKLENGQPSGMGLVKVEQILKRANVNYVITRVVPNHKRALENLKNGAVDGFFLASRNEERDADAVFSDKVMYNNWVWVMLATSSLNPKDPDFRQTAKIGVILNNNHYK